MRMAAGNLPQLLRRNLLVWPLKICLNLLFFSLVFSVCAKKSPFSLSLHISLLRNRNGPLLVHLFTRNLINLPMKAIGWSYLILKINALPSCQCSLPHCLKLAFVAGRLSASISDSWAYSVPLLSSVTRRGSLGCFHDGQCQQAESSSL